MKTCGGVTDLASSAWTESSLILNKRRLSWRVNWVSVDWVYAYSDSASTQSARTLSETMVEILAWPESTLIQSERRLSQRLFRLSVDSVFAEIFYSVAPYIVSALTQSELMLNMRWVSLCIFRISVDSGSDKTSLRTWLKISVDSVVAYSEYALLESTHIHHQRRLSLRIFRLSVDSVIA